MINVFKAEPGPRGMASQSHVSQARCTQAPLALKNMYNMYVLKWRFIQRLRLHGATANARPTLRVHTTPRGACGAADRTPNPSHVAEATTDHMTTSTRSTNQEPPTQHE